MYTMATRASMEYKSCQANTRWMASFMLASSAANSRGFSIDQIEAHIDGQAIHVDGNLTLKLTDDVRKALSKSIPLQLNMEFVLHRVRSYVWDKELAVWTVPIAISYKPVSDEYVVSRPDLLNQEETFGGREIFHERMTEGV